MNSVIAKITDHWTETVSGYILEQYKDASNWKAILKSVIDKYSEIEGEIWKLAPILDFKCRVKGERPTGALLDFIAGIMNVEREVGESDADFYARFVSDIESDNAGTPDNVIYNASILSGDTAPHYMDEAPATFFVYTPGGRQLKKKEVQKMAPCGALGLPGAAIQFADGSVMGDYDGRKILAVADDESRERYVTVNVIAADGRYIVDAAGRRIIAVMKIK